MLNEDALKTLLPAMQGFFSFTRGFKVSALLPVGFDAEGTEVWQKWERPRVASWQGVDGWFSPKHPNTLGELLPGFLRAWNDPTWGETIRMALYWYMQSNTGLGAEGAIILAQSCLEMLAWVLLVQDKKLLTEQQFKKLNMSDTLRRLLSTCGIPSEIPDTLVNLKQLAPSQNWTDGPQVWSEMRNSIVHPDNKKRGLLNSTPIVMEETWHLGMWYIEMVLLRVLGYNNIYVNRLRRDVINDRSELVPWVSTS